jgi:hypothetical protein
LSSGSCDHEPPSARVRPARGSAELRETTSVPLARSPKAAKRASQCVSSGARCEEL